MSAVIKPLQRVIEALRTSDGAGVSLYRSLGQSQFARLDPFLMLDEFGSDRPNEYIAGFPAHPHRGFQTVTYMLAGHMLHEDHLGNRGYLKAGGVQWMTAGRGIIHSEMPQQESGLMRGFQLWINLPSKEKMRPAEYRDLDANEIPVHETSDGFRIKVIAGRWQRGDVILDGPITGMSTAPEFWGNMVEELPKFLASKTKSICTAVRLPKPSVRLGLTSAGPARFWTTPSTFREDSC